MSNWLGSQRGRVVKNVQITQSSAMPITINNRKIIRSGILINDDVLGYGLLVNDVDVTDGSRFAPIMIRGSYINSNLPQPLSATQINMLAQRGLFEVKTSSSRNIFTITTNVTNGSISGPQTISEGGLVELLLTPNDGYDCPNGRNLYVTNAMVSYDENSGRMTLHSPTGNVAITVTCPIAMNLSVRAATDSDGSLFGKMASELQEDIAINNNIASGTLKYVTGYDAFSGDEQDGNFLAIKCTASSGTVITCEVFPGYSGAKTLDSDGLFVARIESVSQSIIITGTNPYKTTEIWLSLHDLDIMHQPV